MKKLTKAEKAQLKKEMHEKKMQELSMAQETAKAELGIFFDSAQMMFRTMNPDKKLSVDAYLHLADFWKFAEKLAEVDVEHTQFTVHQIAEACRKRYFYTMSPSEITKMTEDEALVFIKNIVEFHNNAKKSAVKPKVTYSVIKMGLADINEDGSFDSSKALDLTGAEISEVTDSSMRKVLTAEDGLFRDIKNVKGKHYDNAYKQCLALGYTEEQAKYEAMGLNMVSIDYNVDRKFKEVQEKIKDLINRGGLFDIATQDRYFFLKCTPSESRKGTVTFICQNKNKGWQETFDWWYLFTGTGNFKGFAEALGKPVPGTQNAWSLRMYQEEALPHETFEGYCARTDKPVTEYKFNISKMMTRLASQGSNSFNSKALLNPEMYDELKQTKVLIVPNRDIKLYRNFKTWNDDCTDLVEKEDIIKLTGGDGQMLGSPEFHARVTRMLNGISDAEYNYYLETLKVYNDDVQLAGKKDPVFRKIQLKIYSVIQGRGGKVNFLSFKGISVMVDFKKFTVKLTYKLAKQLNKLNGTNFKAGDTLELKNYDVICPESVAKFIVVDNEDHEFKWDVCNHSKQKGEWVCMNPQFIASLSAYNPNLFTPILKWWCDYIDGAFDDTAKMLHLMNIISHSGQSTEAVDTDDITDDENESVDSVDIATMITVNDKWKSDPYILSRIKDKIEKFMNEMAVGRIRVPGVYTYMVQDPYKMLQMYFNIPNMQYTLKKGQFYFNNKKCRAGLFRSPLVAPFQAQAVQLIENDYYWLYRDVIVFNAVDGTWDLMGGADFDGDTCAVVPEDDANGFGKIVVDAVRSNQMIVYAPARGAKEVVWNPDNYEAIIDYLNGVGRDNTGVYTNYATRLLALANHLRGLVFMAKTYGANKIEFCHPEAFGRNSNYGVDFGFRIAENDKEKVIVRAIVPCKWNPESRKHEFFTDNAILGEYTIEQVEELAEQKTVREVNIMTVVQMEEIDGAKTGYHPSVPEECVYTQNPAWMIARQKFLKRIPWKYEEDKNGNPDMDKPKKEPDKFTVSGLFSTLDTTQVKMFNAYRSYDMMGRIYEYTYMRRTEIFKRFKQGTDKISYLKSLMTVEERNQLNIKLRGADGKEFTLLEHLKERKTQYNKNIHNMKNAHVDEQAENLTLANLKYKEVKYLKLLSEVCSVDLSVIAYGCYIASYNKNEHQNEGLSYAWILWTELAGVSSRGNCSFELLSIPSNTENAYVLGNTLFINDKKFANNINAEDGTVAIQRFGGSKAFALIHKINGAPIVNRTVRVSAGAEYEIGICGLGYANRKCKNVLEWQNTVKAFGFEFYIVEDSTGALCTAVYDQNGVEHILAQVMLKNKDVFDNSDLELKGRKVRVAKSPNYKNTKKDGTLASAITGLRVCVID